MSLRSCLLSLATYSFALNCDSNRDLISPGADQNSGSALAAPVPTSLKVVGVNILQTGNSGNHGVCRAITASKLMLTIKC